MTLCGCSKPLKPLIGFKIVSILFLKPTILKSISTASQILKTTELFKFVKQNLKGACLKLLTLPSTSHRELHNHILTNSFSAIGSLFSSIIRFSESWILSRTQRISLAMSRFSLQRHSLRHFVQSPPTDELFHFKLCP